MKIRFLGTGTSSGNPEIGCRCKVCLSSDKRDKRLRSSVLIKVAKKNFLIDCGPDIRTQLLNTFEKNPFQYLDGVFITHEHYDHLGGLDDLRCFGKTGRIINIYAEQVVTKAIKERLPYIFTKGEKYPGIPLLKLHEINHKPFLVLNVLIIPIRLLHGKLPILGYRIEDFAYLTDLTIIPTKEIEKLQNLSVIVMNSLRQSPHTTHQNLEQALENIKKIKPKKAYLTHMCHQFGLHKKIQKILPKNIFIAYDGLEIHV